MTFGNIIDMKAWTGAIAATTLVKLNLIVVWLQPVALIIPLAYTIWKWRKEWLKDRAEKDAAKEKIGIK